MDGIERIIVSKLYFLEMEAVVKYDRFVQKYLKKTKRFKTLEEFQKSVDRKQKKGTFY